MSKTILVFGTFDPLHAGHQDFFRQAAALGDQLLVVVARDTAIRQQKKREPYQPEATRLRAVQQVPAVTMALLGDDAPGEYGRLRTQSFDVLALGYDQQPADVKARQVLDRLGKKNVALVRLQPFKPEQYKSSYLRSSGTLS